MKGVEPKSSTISPSLQTKSEEQHMPFFDKEGTNGALSNRLQPFFGLYGGPDNGQKPFFNNPGFQTKLTIGQHGDKYEQEADSMADQVVQRLAENDNSSKQPLTAARPGIQSRPIFKNEDQPEVQAKPLNDHSLNVPHIQEKCAAFETEEQEQDSLQEEPLQMKPIFESAVPPLEDDSLQRKCADCTAKEEGIQKMSAQEEEEPLRAKPEDAGPSSAPPDLESRLSSSRGSGNPLPDDTRTQMEGTFGADFSGVRVHTDSSAVQMNKELGAQAFTHRSDIYFNSGKYDTSSSAGQGLLGHELTHTVQQGGEVQKKPISRTSGSVIQRGFWGTVGGGIKSAGSWVGGKVVSGAQATWRGAKWAGEKVGDAAEWTVDQAKYIGTNALNCAKATGRSANKLVTLDFDSLSDLLGMPQPKGEGPSILEGIQFVINHACLKMIPGYRLLLSGMNRLKPYMKFLNGAWRVMTNPSELFDAIMTSPALSGMVGGIPARAKSITQKAITFSNPSSEHLDGIWRHLEPKLDFLAGNWHDVLKDTALDLLWPWPGVWGDLNEIWDSIKSVGSQVWDLNFGGAIDGILSIWRTLNTLLGRLYGWFFIISVVIGAIIGAFFGGAGAIPGALAGAKFALAVGEVLLISMVAAESLSIGKAGFDLVFIDQSEEEKEDDYEQIASSGLALAIVGVMFALGAIAVRFARGLLNRVRGLFRKKPPKKQKMQSERAEKIRDQKIKDGIKKLDDDIAKGKVKMSKEDIDWLNSNSRHKELSYDVAKKKYEIGEAKAALKAEKQGSLSKPVKRSAHEGDDFIDGLGRNWDAKWVDPSKSIKQIVDETIALAKTGENILLDLSAVNPVKANQIRIQVSAKSVGTPGEVVFVPKGLPEGGTIGGVTGDKVTENVP